MKKCSNKQVTTIVNLSPLNKYKTSRIMPKRMDKTRV